MERELMPDLLVVAVDALKDQHHQRNDQQRYPGAFREFAVRNNQQSRGGCSGTYSVDGRTPDRGLCPLPLANA